MTTKRDAAKTAEKQPYDPPVLTEYGALEDLTAGGTGNANEGSPGTSAKRP